MKVKSKKNTGRKLFQVGKPTNLSILDLFPYKNCTKEGILVTRYDTYQRYFQIESTDVEGLNEQEKAERMDQLTRLMRTYIPDIKQETLTTETDLSEQINEKRRLLQKNRLEQMKGVNTPQLRKFEKVLIEEIKELQKSEKERPNLSFFLIIEGETILELQNRSNIIMKTSGVLHLKPMNRKNIIQILFRKNNMNVE